ncbi:nucleotidyltransferase domain-containing protein [Nonomuraea harbinensis]|uniref:Nucleotidyltransferase domain-containing protein n=1 Tax=Nonomuraea harbinensis TaxID=1286938 RepID=A0ABW1BX25_9ACTN|nr:nucleotidyltransferase domain-containing protein [Nonomuraea harbinensis]
MRTVVAEMAGRLVEVPGVVGVLLGGSRARGEHRPESDWDLGVYYRAPLDVEGLRKLAGPGVEVAGPGGWGPWVDGGAWLELGGVAVDWILRDVDRVRRVWEDCREGRYEVGVQVGHPLGFWSPCYAGEVALGAILADPHGELGRLRREAAVYPERLRESLMGAAEEAGFLVEVAGKGVGRADTLYVALCLSRAVGVLVQALFAAERRWCLNEKGALAVAETLPGAPAGFGRRARALLGGLGETPESLATAVDAARELVAETRDALHR